METAIVKVLADIRKALDGGDLTILMLLDHLSPAFDIVDHAILLRRLVSSCGFRGCVLAWFTS